MSLRADNRPSVYRGRFAPSPSGPLHFGSLVAAVGSYLQARHHQGEWLLRIDDLDPPREVPGAADRILRTLEAYHLHWDGAVLYQSRRFDAYQAALEQLATQGYSYPCACSRKEIAAASAGGHVYPGTCRAGLPPRRTGRAIRVRTGEEQIHFEDGLQGMIICQLGWEVGDFIVRRADGLYAYHLAVVVDDVHQQISEVVRGADLLDSTPPQRYLQGLLGLPRPAYLHLPIAVDSTGRKLSKQTRARAVDTAAPGATLTRVLDFLGHPPPSELTGAGAEELLAWAVTHWRPARLPRVREIRVIPDAAGGKPSGNES